MPTIKTDDGETLSFDITGSEQSGPPLLLSNSLGTTRAMWQPQIGPLSARLRVIQYDTRGHGDSSGGSGDYTLERLARDALNLMDALDLDHVNWCGLSLGGMIGQQLAISAQKRLRSLILANTGAYIGAPDFWNQRMATVRSRGIESITDNLIERWFTPEFRALRPEIVGQVSAMLTSTPVNGYCGCCAAIRDMDLRPGLPGVRLPILVLAGNRDPAIPPEKSQEIVRLAPNARLITLEAAHLSNIERPSDFTEHVLKFVAET